MSLDEATRQRIRSAIESHDVVLFMKGTPEAPQCGFSARVVQILGSFVPSFGSVDVLSDPAVREGIKEYSDWPTIPQLYVRGELVGGCDIVQELHASGELAAALGVAVPEAVAPRVEISDAAAAALRDALAGAPEGHVIHLSVDARHQSSLFLAPPAPTEVVAEANGVTLALDALSASRADGASLDVMPTPQGPAFRVSLPGAPSVRTLDVTELKRRLDAGESFELLDVRTPEEREIAHIPGAVLVDEAVVERLEKLPRDTTLVFHCHHGGRSQAAAEHFLSLGFTDVWNVVGGIDAWSIEVDPGVPRY